MFVFLRCACLLGLALFAPIALPAGGGFDSNILYLRRRSNFSPLIAGDNCFLHTSPLKHAPSLRRINHGTPLKILRKWNSSNGQMWLQVELTDLEILEQLSSVRRGWISV